MNTKKIIIILFVLIILGGLAFAAVQYFGSMEKTPDPGENTSPVVSDDPEPATDVSQLTPENAKNLRFFQVRLTGAEMPESIVIYTMEDTAEHVIDTYSLADEKWTKVATKSLDLNTWSIEGVQRIDINNDDKQEFYVLLNKEDGEAKYILLSYEKGSYKFYDQPAITDKTVGDNIELSGEETRTLMIGFNVSEAGIQEGYAIYCGPAPETPEEIEQPCRSDLFLVEFKEGKFKRTRVEPEPVVAEEE